MAADRSGSLGGIVLAAGASTRMGCNKLFLELEGQTLLRRVVGRALQADLDPVIVVLGHEAARARRELSRLPCELVINPHYARGMSSSLGSGIGRLPAIAAGALVLLADMPFVTVPMIRTLVGRHRESAAPLVISHYGDVSAPPVLFDRSLFAELQALEGDGCGKRVIERHRSQAIAVPWPVAALTDLDAPEDYERVRRSLEAESRA